MVFIFFYFISCKFWMILMMTALKSIRKTWKSAAIACLVLVPFLYPVQASEPLLDVPIMEISSGDLDTCGFGKVSGLKAEGDGFLAVRSGPGTNYAKIDELHNGDEVWLFEGKGDWIGIVYGTEGLSCSPIAADREVPYRGKKGWVHKNWVELIAG